LVGERKIEMGHARALLGLTHRGQQVEVAKLVAQRGLSVRDTESLVRRLQKPDAEKPPAGADADVRRLETELGERLGTKVTFKHGATGKGQMVIQYSSLEELDGILARIH
jgi:ParB family chromosome partitioning protein